MKFESCCNLREYKEASRATANLLNEISEFGPQDVPQVSKQILTIKEYFLKGVLKRIFERGYQVYKEEKDRGEFTSLVTVERSIVHLIS